MIYPGIIGTGFYVPKNKMDNARLSKINKVPTKEIYEKTGIKERRIADKMNQHLIWVLKPLLRQSNHQMLI